MSNVLKYKNYWAVVEYSAEDGILHGRIDGISDLVTFECESVKEVQKEFESAVDDYEAFCKEVGKEPEKAFSGSFNVRIAPELHRKISIEAAKQKITLNKFVSDTLSNALVSNKTIIVYANGSEWDKNVGYATTYKGQDYGTAQWKQANQMNQAWKYSVH